VKRIKLEESGSLIPRPTLAVTDEKWVWGTGNLARTMPTFLNMRLTVESVIEQKESYKKRRDLTMLQKILS